MKDIAEAVRLIDERIKGIQSERDKLAHLMSEWSDLLDHCEDALTHLEDARDTLSQLI